jgi:DNA-binding transcriptional MerR regulator
MASESFTLAQLARAVGMSIEDAQSYRDSGLLPRARRRPGRSDEFGYHREHLERLRFIKRALALGYEPEDITQLLEDGGLRTCNDVYQITARKVEQLRARSGDGGSAPTALEQLLGSCPRKGGRTACPILTALSADEG